MTHFVFFVSVARNFGNKYCDFNVQQVLRTLIVHAVTWLVDLEAWFLAIGVQKFVRIVPSMFSGILTILVMLLVFLSLSVSWIVILMTFHLWTFFNFPKPNPIMDSVHWKFCWKLIKKGVLDVCKRLSSTPLTLESYIIGLVNLEKRKKMLWIQLLYY